MTRCQSIRRDLGPFVDGELSLSRRTRLARHLDECAECASLLREVGDIGDRLRESAAAQDTRALPFENLASGVVSRMRAESALSWRAWVTHACDDWHWAIVASGSMAATCISTLLVSAILAFGPAPAREDSLSALMANLGAPAGMMFVCASPTGTNQDATLFQVENGQPQASRMTAALAEMACHPMSEADVTGKLASAVTGASGQVLKLDAMHPAARRYTEALLTEIARIRASQAPIVARAVDIHEVRLVTGMAVVAKAL